MRGIGAVRRGGASKGKAWQATPGGA